MKSVFAIFLAMLMLITNVQIALATHYCDGEAVKTSIYVGHGDIDCGMSDQDAFCEKEYNPPAVKSKNCCENKYAELSIEDDYKNPSFVKAVPDVQFIAAFIITYLNLYSFDPSIEAGYSHYSPPLLDLDIPVLIQSFLI
ncbi:MAG: HYC_CC_PP family protein [Bacteroidia bacterium]